MSLVYLSLGSNKGSRFNNLVNALLRINSIEKTLVSKVSSFYETEPYIVEAQSKFINIAAEVFTELEPFLFHNKLLEIERHLGRLSKGDWQPREIDIDILLFDDLVIETETLTIPHKDLHNRRFVLEPLCEINPSLIHPVFKKNIKKLLSQLKDHYSVIKLC